MTQQTEAAAIGHADPETVAVIADLDAKLAEIDAAQRRLADMEKRMEAGPPPVFVGNRAERRKARSLWRSGRARTA